MGTFYGYNSKESLVQYLTKDSLDYSICGNVVYNLVKSVEGILYIRVDVLKHGDGEWGFKPIDARCGPYYYDCPERILKASTDRNSDALAWIEKCRQLRGLKKDKKSQMENLWNLLPEWPICHPTAKMQTEVGLITDLSAYVRKGRKGIAGKNSSGNFHRYGANQIHSFTIEKEDADD